MPTTPSTTPKAPAALTPPHNPSPPHNRFGLRAPRSTYTTPRNLGTPRLAEGVVPSTTTETPFSQVLPAEAPPPSPRAQHSERRGAPPSGPQVLPYGGFAVA